MPDAPDARGDLLLRLLQANMSWELTHGRVIGMLPADQEGDEGTPQPAGFAWFGAVTSRLCW